MRTPTLNRWEFPAPSRSLSEDDYANLDIFDLSKVDVVEDHISSETKALAERLVRVCRTTGFFVITGHGLSDEMIQRHFDLGKMLIDDVPLEEKKRLLSSSHETGQWAGYKLPRTHSDVDRTEHFDMYPETIRSSLLPPTARPFLREFREFCKHQHFVILYKVLGLISIGLGLSKDRLWKLHHRGISDTGQSLDVADDDQIDWPHSHDHYSYKVYLPLKDVPRTKEWLRQHADRGTVSLIYSQPVQGLQVIEDGKWKYVKYYPGGIVVNAGESFEALTAGLIRGAPHRVAEPPEDQRHMRRLGIFYFSLPLRDVLLQPLKEFDNVEATDKFAEYRRLGGPPMTCNDWAKVRTRLMGTKRPETRKGDERTWQDAVYDLHFEKFI